jgi:hypothetical protein
MAEPPLKAGEKSTRKDLLATRAPALGLSTVGESRGIAANPGFGYITGYTSETIGEQ